MSINFPASVTNETQQRLAWSLKDISEATGLSMGFLRNEVNNERLPIKRYGRRVLVLNEDLRSYLVNGSPVAAA